MPSGVNTQANHVYAASVVQDAGSEALNYPSVWRGGISGNMRRPMPKGTNTIELKLNGRQVRKVVAENAQFVWDSDSEILQTKVTLQPFKSVTGYKRTVEVDEFEIGLSDTEIGESMGNALRIGHEEDIAAIIATATSQVVATNLLTPIDLAAGILDVRTSTRNRGGKVRGTLSNKQAMEVGILHPYSGGNTTTSYANPNGGNTDIQRTYGEVQPDGFVGKIFGANLYATDIVDDNGSDYIGAVYDPDIALCGVWGDEMKLLAANDPDYLRLGIVGYSFADFNIYRNEAICKILSDL